MPDIQTAVPAAPARPPPAPHPMDPRRGEHLSPMFAAFLAWLLDLEPMTDPAIAGICIAGNSVLAATTDNPLFDAHLGSLADFGHGGGQSSPRSGGARPMRFPDLPANDCGHGGGPRHRRSGLIEPVGRGARHPQCPQAGHVPSASIGAKTRLSA